MPVFSRERPCLNITITGGPDKHEHHDREAASFQERWDNCAKPRAGYAIASLLSMKMLIPENNYPQTYPRLENMLVNANYLHGTAEQTLAAK
ncbi:hypothetical protein [Achromobacter anxifer]